MAAQGIKKDLITIFIGAFSIQHHVIGSTQLSLITAKTLSNDSFNTIPVNSQARILF